MLHRACHLLWQYIKLPDFNTQDPVQHTKYAGWLKGWNFGIIFWIYEYFFNEKNCIKFKL